MLQITPGRYTADIQNISQAHILTMGLETSAWLSITSLLVGNGRPRVPKRGTREREGPWGSQQLPFPTRYENT